MNNQISDIAKKAQDDYQSSQKLVEHFNSMIQKFVEAQSKIIDKIQALKTRDVGVREAQNKCIVACQTLRTDICSKMDFIGGSENANAVPNQGLELI